MLPRMATYDEIQPGDSATFTKTLSESDIYLFAGITGDLNPAHVDAVTAASGMFKQRIAHGMLTGSFVSTVLAMKLPGPGTIYVGQELQFRGPVFIGDTVTAKVECTEKLEQRKWVKFKTTVTNQDGKLVVDGVATVIPPAG
jgi:3-hydroxybutyryl-CoA dehydratase